MKCFQCKDAKLQLTTQSTKSPAITIEDCKISNHENRATIYNPGFVVQTENDTNHINKMNGTKVASFNTTAKATHYIFDNRRCYMIDNGAIVYVFEFGGANEPKIIDLQRKPFGWCVIPTTQTIVHWDPMVLHVSALTGRKNLKGHRVRITAGSATETVLVTGDNSGTVRVWYVASWTCHHVINTGGESCKQICLSDTRLFVRCEHFIHIYDITSGILVKHIEIHARDICITKYGLIVATDNHIVAYKNGKPTVKFAHQCSAVIPTIAERFIAVSPDKAIEIRIGADHAGWAAECLQWVRNPHLPFVYRWPTKRYMDILAQSIHEWIPLVRICDLPSVWLRHDKLRDAIWDNVLDNDIVADWSYLPQHIQNKWYHKCQLQIVALITHFEYNQSIIDLIKQIYKKTTIKHATIMEYCWFHHGHVDCIHILLKITEQNCTFLESIHREPITPDSILCFSPQFVRAGLKNDYVVYFIHCMIACHREYPHVPTDKMRKIFTMICEYIYDVLTTDNADIPLQDSGQWKIIDKIGPQHKGCYIRSSHMTGFITTIEITPDIRNVYWRPNNRSREILIDTASNTSVWEYYHKNGPNTILECALTMIRTDIWNVTKVVRPFIWFSSENGAFLAETCSIMVYKEAIRITHASWKDGVATLETDTKMSITDAEQAHIEWVVPLWSYCESNVYHSVPLKLKICHCLSTAVRANLVDVLYAKELFECITPKTCFIETKWNTISSATAFGFDLRRFLVGFQDGAVIEYSTCSDIEYPIRIYEKHPSHILDISIMEQSFVSLCEDMLCKFCLITGTKLMTIHTNMQFKALLSLKNNITCLIEAIDTKGIVTVWDFETTTRMKRFNIVIDDNIMVTNNIIVSNNRVYLVTENEIEHVITLNVEGDITCIADIGVGICGGTSEGIIFKLDIAELKIKQWTTLESFAITAMTMIPNSTQMLSGTSSGQMSLWDHTNTHIIMCINITNTPLTHIFADGMFAIISSYKKLTLATVVHNRCILAMHVLNSIIFWSHAWKMRLLKECETLLKPTVAMCLKYKSCVTAVFELLEECTSEYQYCAHWCKPDIIKIIAETIATGASQHAISILTRIACYNGPKFECVICSDEDKYDSISRLQTCDHRFHTGCLAELVRKVPEYHDEMQYEYALKVTLKCPICRASFASKQIELDTELNKYYNYTHD